MKRLPFDKDNFNIIFLVAITLFITLLIWLPYILRINFFGLNFSSGFETIYRNYDGIEYIIIAKTLYNTQLIAKLPQSLSANYYASHFPGFSLAMMPFAAVLGYLKSMILVSVIFTVFSTIALYYLAKEILLIKSPVWLAFVSLILPARWLIVHSVGTPEPMFIFFTILTFYFFSRFERLDKRRDLLLASLSGFFAQLARPPGILIFISLCCYILWKIARSKNGDFLSKIWASIKRYYPILSIPLMLFFIFIWYQIAFHNFFAYFHSGDNIHLTLPPFAVFNKNQYWVGDIWLEDIVYIFLLGFFATFILFKKKLYPIAFFTLIYLTATVFVAHRDISRYTLPVVPFVLLAYEKAINSKEFKIALIIIALGIYLYAQNFILNNTGPYPNLGYFN